MGEWHQQHNWSSEGARAHPATPRAAAPLSLGPKPLLTLPEAAARSTVTPRFTFFIHPTLFNGTQH